MHPDDQSLTPSIATHGYWESWISTYVANNVKDKVFFDLGANCGYYSMLAATFGAKRVLAFEPNPRYVTLLKANQWENNVKDMYIIDKAVSDKHGSVDLNFYGDLDGSATIVSPTESHIKALSTTLDDYADCDEPVLMKIDVEGAEEKVFDGGQVFLNNNKVEMVMEWTPGAYSDEFWDKLIDFGSVNLLDYNGNLQATTRNHVLSQTDWITLVIKNY